MRSFLGLLAIAVCLLTACTSTVTDVLLPDDENPARPLTDTADVPEPITSTTRADVECSAEALGEDEFFEFTSAYFVVDGQLGEVCFGEPDSTVEEAFDELAIITPQDQLADLALFAGFSEDEDLDEITAAFVNVTDDEGTDFQMSINVTDFGSDRDEALLTVAHEFAHVFTLIPSQIDRTIFDRSDCDTYYTLDGCFFEDSIINQWVSTFWGDGLIDQIAPEDEPSNTDGQDRCDTNPGFFGAYAASNPEEDFAETFSAYVYQLEPDTVAQQAKLDWIDDQPGLAEFRQRAIDAGRGPLRNNFDVCG